MPAATGVSPAAVRCPRAPHQVVAGVRGSTAAASAVLPMPTGVEQALDRVDARQGDVIKSDEQVPGFDSGRCRRSTCLDAPHPDRSGLIDREGKLDAPRQRHRRTGDAQVSAAHPAVGKQLSRYPSRGIDAHCEPNLLRPRESRLTQSGQ